MITVDLKELQKDLAINKVYNAWQYVESLCEIISYMAASYALIEEVYKYRINCLKNKEAEIFNKAELTGRVAITPEDLNCTNLCIASLEIDDELYLRKTTIEFFHYARMSIDIIFQIINASLFGDECFDSLSKTLITDVNNKLASIQSFINLKAKLDANRTNETYKYLQAFDNYCKHIKTVLLSIKNSFLIGDSSEFIIKSFSYSDRNGTYSYNEEDALIKIREIKQYTESFINDVLLEIQLQLPNCIDNSARIQKLTYKAQIKETENGQQLDYFSFFLEVENDISELPSEIKVLPLLIRPNDEIHYFDFNYDIIFIKKQGADDIPSNIIGCARRNNTSESNEFYKTFTVARCDEIEYIKYLATFNNCDKEFNIDLKAIEGSILLYKE